MPTAPRAFGRYTTRTILLVGTVVVVVLSLSAALATRHGSLVVAAAPIVGSVLVVTLFVVARRALRRASARIDRILREELDAAPTDQQGPRPAGNRTGEQTPERSRTREPPVNRQRRTPSRTRAHGRQSRKVVARLLPSARRRDL